MEKTVIVLRVSGLTEEQIQEEFSDFFAGLTAKYPNKFGCGTSVMTDQGAKEVLEIADLEY